MRSLEMKSLASSDVSMNSCSSKFHWLAKMLFIVWLSSSPRKGQRPLRLKEGHRCSLTVGFYCAYCVCLCVYIQHVCDDAKAPHVCVEWHKVIVDDFRSQKLWSPEIHSQLLPWFISAWDFKQKIISHLKIDYNSGNKMEVNTSTYILARPKSMILILFVILLTQRMFSGWILKQNSSSITKVGQYVSKMSWQYEWLWLCYL